MSILSKIKQGLILAGKVLVGHAFGLIDKSVPLHTFEGDTLVLIAMEIAKGDIQHAALPSLTSEQKRILVAAVIEQIILRSPLGHGKKLRDPVIFREKVRALTGDFADVMNCFDADGLELKDVT